MNVRIREAVDKIREQSSGRMELQIFPNSQLGGDTDMLSRLRTPTPCHGSLRLDGTPLCPRCCSSMGDELRPGSGSARS